MGKSQLPSASWRTNYKYQIRAGGFTLVEVSVAGVLLMALGAGILGLQYILGKSQISTFNNYIAVDEANAAVSTFIREFRTARASDAGAYPIVQASDNQIVFYSDVDFDGQSERIRYFLEATTLKKGTIEPVGFPVTYPTNNEKIKIITDKVRNNASPVFTYFNGDWPADTQNNPLITPANLLDVRMVGINLRLNANANDPDTDYILESSAQIRMLKDNL